MFPTPPRIPVTNAQKLPVRISFPPENRFESAIAIITGTSPSGNRTWFIHGEIRSTTSFDCNPHAPQSTIVRSDNQSHAGKPRGTSCVVWDAGMIPAAYRRHADRDNRLTDKT